MSRFWSKWLGRVVEFFWIFLGGGVGGGVRFAVSPAQRISFEASL